MVLGLLWCFNANAGRVAFEELNYSVNDLTRQGYKITFVNQNEAIDIPILEIGAEAEQKQTKALQTLKENRDSGAVQSSLDKIQKACVGTENLVPLIVEAAKADATLGEIVDAMKKEFGEWQETAVF